VQGKEINPAEDRQCYGVGAHRCIGIHTKTHTGNPACPAHPSEVGVERLCFLEIDAAPALKSMLGMHAGRLQGGQALVRLRTHTSSLQLSQAKVAGMLMETVRLQVRLVDTNQT
jgi:hypothetical protein